MSSSIKRSEIEYNLGSFFMAGMPGTELDENTLELIKDYGIGGVILFSRNIKDPLQLASLCNALQDCAVKSQGRPLFLAVDQEGGRVARLKEPFTSFPGNSAIGDASNPMAKAVTFARVTAEEMALVGLNMDMAPVLDVRRGVPEKHLEGRTFGDEPQKVALLGKVVVKILQEHGVMATAKHFPGLGKASVDPHHHGLTIDADAGEIEEINLPPFRAAIEVGVCAIMTSHAVYPALDPEVPATLSYKILTKIVRDKMGFDGLVITDDLEMGAIKNNRGVADGAIASFEAGSDILLICEDQEAVIESIDSMRTKLKRNEISLQRIQQSLNRIMDTKSTYLNKWEKVSLEKVRSYFGLIA